MPKIAYNFSLNQVIDSVQNYVDDKNLWKTALVFDKACVAYIENNILYIFNLLSLFNFWDEIIVHNYCCKTVN